MNAENGILARVITNIVQWSHSLLHSRTLYGYWNLEGGWLAQCCNYSLGGCAWFSGGLPDATRGCFWFVLVLSGCVQKVSEEWEGEGCHAEQEMEPVHGWHGWIRGERERESWEAC